MVNRYHIEALCRVPGRRRVVKHRLFVAMEPGHTISQLFADVRQVVQREVGRGASVEALALERCDGVDFYV